MTRSTLEIRDLVTIGVFAAISLFIFFVVGGIAGLTVFGTLANIPIVCLFTAVPFLILAAKVRKTGVFFLMGLINVAPGLLVGNWLGVAICVAGWALAELIAKLGNYATTKVLVAAYVVGSVVQSTGFTFPMYYASEQYLTERRDILRLSDELMNYYLSVLSWQTYISMVVLTAATSLIGALITIRFLNKHFVRAGMVAAG